MNTQQTRIRKKAEKTLVKCIPQSTNAYIISSVLKQEKNKTINSGKQTYKDKKIHNLMEKKRENMFFFNSQRDVYEKKNTNVNQNEVIRNDINLPRSQNHSI